jgi:hypothetical protein
MGRPNGDPGGMRQEANALLGHADQIRNAARNLPQVTSSVFLAPAGNRLHNRLEDIRDEQLRAAGIVEAAAHTLLDEASRLESAIRQWEDDQRRAAQQRLSHR